ncbi:hypothetical protein [Cellulomonas sp.]|uniref:hypothetical protein n=1 Tax=Cellulomonas sp. TaxID=40001 RepID=UPI0025B7BA03|nr:hypothetical protein [Cellulomonas sp.]
MAVVIWTLVALLTAAAVFLVVSASTGADNPLTTFRRGVRARRNPDRDQAAAARAATAAPVDLSLADFLRATASEGDGYLHPDELVEDLRVARERAAAAVRPRRDVVDAHSRTR